jgi:hypothetical protein
VEERSKVGDRDARLELAEARIKRYARLPARVAHINSV